jgi:hypothetical protein
MQGQEQGHKRKYGREMDCTGRGGKMHSKGEVTYEGTTMNGTMIISVEGQPPMTNKVTGKRIGPCK